ncbi:MAG: DUF362 domain-containing protein [Candidatus Wallbacteria bacterium]|nr:DUF362 domain-containing protein [Candidatus Wallbacteria bacterium]
MHKSIVAATRCLAYEPAAVKQALLSVLENSRVLATYSFKDKKVLLKPNLLRETRPEDCVCTHFEVVRQLAVILRERGAEVIVGESSGGVSYGKTARAAETSGLKSALDESGFPFVNLDGKGAKTIFINGKILGSVSLSSLLDEIDILVSVPKMKTHVETMITGAVKNLMGLIPGTGKLDLHRMGPNSRALGEAVADLLLAVKPHFSVMDAVWAMEGNGPNQGTKREVGLILASLDPISLDSVAAWVMGFKSMQVGFLKSAHSRGLGIAERKSIRIAGDSLDGFPIRDFKKGRFSLLHALPNLLLKIAVRLLISVDPEILSRRCRKCMVCKNSCPAKAISPELRIDYKLCTRCLCCHELCPHHAVGLKKSWVMKVLTGKLVTDSF